MMLHKPEEWRGRNPPFFYLEKKGMNMKKGIIKRLIALMLALVLLSSIVVRDYENVKATGIEVAAGYTALQYIIGLASTVGMGVMVKDLVDNFNEDDVIWGPQGWYDGYPVDRPATEKELKDFESWFEKVYYGHTEAYKKTHSNITPSPAPTVTPAITNPPEPVPTIDPDDVEMPLSYDDLKSTSLENGFIAMSAATFYCVKETFKDLWNNVLTIFDTDNIQGIPEDVLNLIMSNNGSGYTGYFYLYENPSTTLYLCKPGSYLFINSRSNYDVSFNEHKKYYRRSDSDAFKEYTYGGMSGGNYTKDSFVSNLPVFDTSQAGQAWRNEQESIDLPSKDYLWVNPNLKDAYDSNFSFPDNTYNPDEKSPIIMLPSLEDIKNLIKQGNDDPDNKPVIIQQFINDHTRDPETDPQPTTSPDNPNPTSAPDVTQVPDLTITPDPDNPDVDDGNPAKEYKSDLRLVFPFCIPFDLVHLIETLDAEPEAPVFTIPIDIEFKNPWTNQKIIDYHEEFSIDMSEFDSVVRILRIFEVVFFIIGLLLITRSLMIRG